MNNRSAMWLSSFGAAVALLCAAGARADDRPFAFAYTTDLEAQHEREIEQEITWSSGHAREAYQDIESRTEFEYGVTDNFQASFYLDHEWSRARVHDPLVPAAATSLPGVSAEFIYRFLNVYFDPIGFALYVEPSIGNGSREFETKALLQKNFLNDALRLVLNVNVEDRWEKNAIGQYDEESALEFYTGAAYNVTPEWSVALELDNERGFDGLILGGSSRSADNAYFAGPAIAWEGERFRAVLGAEAQLPWASDPTHTPGTLANGYLADAERFRIRLRVSADF